MNSTSTGAAVLILNLIKGLASSGQKVALINFVDGVMHKELIELSGELVEVIDNSEKGMRNFARRLTREDVIVSTHFYSVFRYFKKANPRFIFYCVGHVHLLETNRFGRLNFLWLTRMLIRSLKNKKGIFFIEGDALEKSADLLGISTEGFSILPIPVSFPGCNSFLNRRRRVMDNSLCLTYVGRSVDWKIYPVRRMIEDLNSSSLPITVVFYIVTDDACEFATKLPPITNTNLSIRYLENLLPDELNTFLRENSDIHVGMATSALEGAKLGIPTILIDYSFSDFPNGYRYRFLYETPASNMGTDVNEGLEFEGLTMDELLCLAHDERELIRISEHCFEYVRKNHDNRKIARYLIDHVTECSSSLSDISRYLVRYWFRN